MFRLLGTLALSLLLIPSPAFAHWENNEGTFESRALPERHLLADWDKEFVAGAAGERFIAMIHTLDERPVHVELFDGERWLRVEETFRVGETAVLRLDFEEPLRRFELRSDDESRIRFMEWSIVDRQIEPHGPPPPIPGVLPQELTDIGVISRASWGASPTNCTATEDNWYRMAIHHTAGNQTGGGTVQGAAQAVQAYTMGEGFCDVPYQFLVGYDGTLWEGRPYDYYSGATGGGNNNGNIAISFMGCYDATECNVGPHPATDEMMEAANLLVQTLVAMHSIPSDSDSIRGHQNWPGNSTACPGSYVLDRFGELLVPLTPPEVGAELVGFIRHTNLLEPQHGIAGAVVDLDGVGTVMTDNTGFYTFAELDPGTYSICARADGYTEGCRDKTVELDAVNWGSILLERDGGDDDDDTTADDDDSAADDDDSAADDDDSGEEPPPNTNEDDPDWDAAACACSAGDSLGEATPYPPFLLIFGLCFVGTLRRQPTTPRRRR